jgi:hypothetical protein
MHAPVFKRDGEARHPLLERDAATTLVTGARAQTNAS